MKICQKCNKEFPIKLKVENKIKSLQNRAYCLDCSPYKSGNNKKLHDLQNHGHIFEVDKIIFKICPKCKQPLKLDKDNFYIREGGIFYSYCKKCGKENTKNKQKQFKQELINYKGGKCRICGYNKCNQSLDFHHINPKEKDFNISEANNRDLEFMKKELDKCICVCANCHREVHAGITKITDDILKEVPIGLVAKPHD